MTLSLVFATFIKGSSDSKFYHQQPRLYILEMLSIAPLNTWSFGQDICIRGPWNLRIYSATNNMSQELWRDFQYFQEIKRNTRMLELFQK